VLLFPPTEYSAAGRLRFLFVDFHDAHHRNIRVLERFLDVRKLRVLDLYNKIRFYGHDHASSQKMFGIVMQNDPKLSQTRRSSQGKQRASPSVRTVRLTACEKIAAARHFAALKRPTPKIPLSF
jgi:hypothetical protein